MDQVQTSDSSDEDNQDTSNASTSSDGDDGQQNDEALYIDSTNVSKTSRTLMHSTTKYPIHGRFPSTASMARYKLKNEKLTNLDFQNITEDLSPSYVSIAHPPWMNSMNTACRPLPNERTPTSASGTWNTHNITDYISMRQRGFLKKLEIPCFERGYEFTRACEKKALIEYQICNINGLDKVLCSTWVANDIVLIGTKDGLVCSLNVFKLKMNNVPLPKNCLQPHGPSSQPSTSNPQPASLQNEHCAPIRSLQISPNKSLVVTTMPIKNQLGIINSQTRKLITCIQDEEMITTMATQIYGSWIDDTHVIAVADNGQCTMTDLLSTPVDPCDKIVMCSQTTAPILRPTKSYMCQISRPVTAACIARANNELVILNEEGDIAVFRTDTFQQVMLKKANLSDSTPFCIEVQNDGQGLYGIGRMRALSLTDPRTFATVKEIPLRFMNASVRSLTFNGNIIAMGTSVGMISLYDVRAGTFLPFEEHNQHGTNLHCSPALYANGQQLDQVSEGLMKIPCIYTLNFNPMGNILFTGGASLERNLRSCYASFWK